jgi:hypothetical protein
MRESRVGRKRWRKGVPSHSCAGQEAHESMAEVIRTDPALSDLDAIVDYIALDNPDAAKILV